MAKHDNAANWVQIDPETLEGSQAKGYAEYKAAYRAMKDARDAFEASMQAGVPEGSRIVCGYNFGKLSVAVVPDDRKPKQAKATQSLAEFLASQASGGRRA